MRHNCWDSWHIWNWDVLLSLGKVEVLEVQTPQCILNFRKKIGWERWNFSALAKWEWDWYIGFRGVAVPPSRLPSLPPDRLCHWKCHLVETDIISYHNHDLRRTSKTKVRLTFRVHRSGCSSFLTSFFATWSSWLKIVDFWRIEKRKIWIFSPLR